MNDLIEPKNKNLAVAASQYSRDQIIEGSTQLINNTYDVNKRRALQKAIYDIREAITSDADFFSDIDRTVYLFEKSIATCKKLSIGNCREFALMALHYMITKEPKTPAEVYHIEGGDHVFLVIGRKSESDPHQPETWGEEAYICDPWSNTVYPARDYLTHTKNFFQKKNKDDYTNHIQDFDPEKHKLSPFSHYNTQYILQATAKANRTGAKAQENRILLDVFSIINNKYLSIYDKFINDLKKIEEKLKNKYEENDPKLTMIQKKISEIQNITNELRDDFNKFNDPNSYYSYLGMNDDFQKMKSQLQQLRTLRLLPEENNPLNTHKLDESLITMIMKFLHIKPTSARDYNSALKKSEEQLSGLPSVESFFKKR